MSDDAVVLRGGEVLCRGQSVLQIATALEQLSRALRARDPYARGPLFRLLDDFTRAAALMSSDYAELQHQSELSTRVDREDSAFTDEIGVTEAARFLNTSTSNVRARCRRGSIDGRLVGSRWLISRAEVLRCTTERKVS